MARTRFAAGLAAALIMLAGCGTTGHPASARTVSPLSWLASPGGHAQVTFNDDVDTLASALYIEEHAPTAANHLIFEADARTVRTQALAILAAPALLPAHPGAYVRMLADFITVADLLQPGPGYGTEAQDQTAWQAALHASDIPTGCGC